MSAKPHFCLDCRKPVQAVWGADSKRHLCAGLACPDCGSQKIKDMTKKIKVSRVGWIGKSVTRLATVLHENRTGWREYETYVVARRGQRCNWFPEDWPPRRVRITVEEI